MRAWDVMFWPVHFWRIFALAQAKRRESDNRRGVTVVTECEENAQRFDPSIPHLNVRITDLDRGMRLVWQMDQQEEHFAIERRAYELFEKRGCQSGRDWEDWFRAELELHLNE